MVIAQVECLIIPLCFVGFFGIAIVAAAIGYLFKQRTEGEMKQFASQYGMAFTSGGWFGQPSLKGMYKGELPVYMSFYTERHRSGRHSHTVTYFYTKANVDVGTFELDLTKEVMFISGLFKSIGVVKEIQVGDDSFDKEFIIQSNDAAKAQVYLDDARKETIRELFRLGYMRVKVGFGEIYVVAKKGGVNSGQLERTCDLILSLVKGNMSWKTASGPGYVPPSPPSGESYKTPPPPKRDEFVVH